MKSFLQIALVLSVATLIAPAAIGDCQFGGESTQTSKPIVELMLQLQQKISAANENKNIVFSPASIALALALLEAGAAGQTQTELQNILSPTGYAGDVTKLYQSLQHQLNIQQSNATLRLANGLFHSKQLVLKTEYLDESRKCFETMLTNVDFEQEQARQTINEWVANKTCNKISELIKPGVLSSETLSVLASAMYFKASWDEPFYVTEINLDFHPAANGAAQPVKFLQRVDDYYYAEDEDLQLVEIPYDGVPVTMYLIKARAPNTSIETLEPKITYDKFVKLARSRQMKRVDLLFPPFEIRLPTELNEILTQIGLVTMMTDVADFSPMNNRLKVSDVMHEAYIKINENGTEASAATGISTLVKAILDPQTPPPAIPFRVNHPFWFTITHQPTKTILFQGKVNTLV